MLLDAINCHPVMHPQLTAALTFCCSLDYTCKPLAVALHVVVCSPHVLLPLQLCLEATPMFATTVTAHCFPAGYVPPRLSQAHSSSLQSTASDDPDPDPAQQQPGAPTAASSPADQGTGQEGLYQQPALSQAPAVGQSRTVSGSFSSLSVEKRVSSGSMGFADASGMHHHHLQVLCCL